VNPGIDQKNMRTISGHCHCASLDRSHLKRRTSDK
jgi:hypothetical protein